MKKHAPKSVLTDDALYFTDNGAILHGRCCGMSARFNGWDISGQKVQMVTGADRKAWVLEVGEKMVCESCNKS